MIRSTFDVEGVGREQDRRHALAHQLREVEAVGGQLDLSRRDALDVEEVVDEAAGLVELPAQHFARRDGPRIVGRQPVDQGAGDDGGRERSPQLVGEHRDELVLLATRALGGDARRALARERLLEV